MLQETTAGQELMEMGSMNAFRIAIGRFVQGRFEAFPRGLKETIQQISDRETAEQAVNLAASAESLRDFERELNALLKG